MAVEAVPGYGPITKANAPMIYRDRKVYENLSEDQKHLVERYIPDEQRDEIDYEIRKTNGKENGKDRIEDNKKAEDHGGQGGNATATSAVAMGSTAAGILFGKAAQDTLKVQEGKTDFAPSALLAGGIALAIGALCLVSAKKFDNGYKDRTSCSDNAENTNGIIDTQSDALQSSMDMMDKDVQEYLEGSKQLMKKSNDNNSKLADLQVQYADCQAAGDTAGAEKLKAQIKQRHEATFDKEQDALDEKKKGIDDYRIMGDETDGVIEAGSNVSDFLKEGTPLGVMATINAVALAVTTVLAGICTAKAAASAKTPWTVPIAAIAAALFAATTVLLGASTMQMAQKAKKEYECGSNGRDMEGHVNALSKMKDSQSTYTDETEETYTEEDEQRTETVEEGKEMANENSTSNRGQVITYKPYGSDDDDKNPNGKKKKGKNKAGAKV